MKSDTESLPCRTDFKAVDVYVSINGGLGVLEEDEEDEEDEEEDW